MSLAEPVRVTAEVKALAHALGFDLVGVAPARATRESRFLRDWVARGYAGDLAYLTERVDERVDPLRVLPDARSAIVLGLAYGGPSLGPEAEREAGAGSAEVARYARGDDYHELMLDRVRALHASIEAWLGEPIVARAYVDTGPLVERALAAHSGIGWIGKNTCLIHPELGSYVFLGVLLCDLELICDAPEADHCGRCRACLDACPTDAFSEAYVLDATRCIAYTTIEDPGPVPEALREAHAGHVYGCDVCQEVCPWNEPGRTRAPRLADPLGLHERLAPRPHWDAPTLDWLLDLDEEAWRKATRDSAMRRSGYRGLLRNAIVAAGGSGEARHVRRLEEHAAGDDELLAEHARWALARLQSLPGASV